MKKIIIGAMAVLAATAAFAAPKKATDGGKVLNIYCWNDEFQSRFNDYYAKAKPKALDGVKVNFIINPNEGNNYQNKLDAALFAQATAEADDRIDLFCVEADYALKYVNTDFTLDVYKDIGLKAKDTANQYKYTKDVMTDKDGVLKGVSWQSTPGGFVYRRSIAKAVLGTDDPAKVQEAISDWSKFDAVAAKMKEKGYFMLAGYDDAFRAFSDNVKTPWVRGNKIQIDPQIEAWIKQTKEYTDKGYNNKTKLWESDWSKGTTKDAKVFGYFGVGWFIDFCMDASSSGDWAFCEGPQGFSWGGTWICAASGTDNKTLVKEVMYALTCDSANMQKLAEGTGDVANNSVVLNNLAKGSYKNKYLGGQNHMALFAKSAGSIDKSTMTKYDQGMTENIMNAMHDYFAGNITLEKAWDNFYTAIAELYPNLKK